MVKAVEAAEACSRRVAWQAPASRTRKSICRVSGCTTPRRTSLAPSFSSGVLLLVNEDGELATGRVTEAEKFGVLKGDGWEEGLVGELVEKGKAISWANGTTWKRP